MILQRSRKSITGAILALAQECPECEWLQKDDGAWLTVAETVDRAMNAASWLHDNGVRPTDRVVIVMDNSPLFRILEIATFLMGAVRVALTPRLHPREVVRIAADCEARVICCDPSRAPGLASALAGAASRSARPAVVLPVDPGTGEVSPRHRVGIVREPSDPAVLLYTSGTTGAPKGATVSHRAWMRQVDIAMEQLPPIDRHDRVLLVAPMAHFGGSMALDAALLGAATTMRAAFEPVEVLETVLTERITVLPLAPVMVSMLVDAAPPELVARAARQLRAIPYGGSPLAFGRLLAAARAFPGLLCQYYGLSETLAPVTALTSEEHDRGVRAADSGDLATAAAILTSAGFAARDTEVLIRPGADGTGPGAVCVRSPLVTHGYWGHGGALRPATTEGGWFVTSDLGTFGDDGLLRLHGRHDDVIISGGFNVIPDEVEAVLRGVPGVRDVVVIGVPDEKWGERVHAVLVLDDPNRDIEELASAIEAACRAEIAAYKRPRSLEVVAALPRTALEKIDRRALRARYPSGR